MNQPIVIFGGSTGLVGGALKDSLRNSGYRVLPLVRPETSTLPESIPWDPGSNLLDAGQLEGAEAVIHLGGAGVAERAWTRERKQLIRQSRIQSTRLLAERLGKMKKKPEVFVCASAIGYYGNRADEFLNEKSAPGQDFLGEVCQAWEEATVPAASAGIRVVNLRIGIVLAREGGALNKMATPFRLGLGGQIGSGKQFMSWIHLTDLINAIIFCLKTETIHGPVNLTAPNPATNKEFSSTLGSALNRLAILPFPQFAVSLIFGEMGRSLLLGGARVIPEVLQNAGFQFQYPELKPALENIFN